MDRRLFLKMLGMTGAGLALPNSLPLNVFAQAPANGYFILITVESGWDTSLSTDPWIASQRPAESDYYLEYLQSDLLPFGSGFLGPAMQPLSASFDRMAVFNGVFMNARDNGHPAMQRYAETGNGQGNLAVLPFEIEGRFFKSDFGVVANTGVYGASRPVSVWSTGSIRSKNELQVVESFTSENGNTEVEAARNSLLKHEAKINEYNRLLRELLTRSEQISEGQSISLAFAANLSKTAMLKLRSGNLDTHSAHPQAHKNALTQAMSQVAEVCQALKGFQAPGQNGQSLYDVTTILVVSEFSRTPALNASLGKDHNPQSNSAILIGPGVQSGKIGQAKLIERNRSEFGTPYLVGAPLDNATHEVVDRREGSFILRPENVMATTLAAMGMNASMISTSLGKASVLKNALK